MKNKLLTILFFSILFFSLFNCPLFTLEKDDSWDFKNSSFIYDLKIDQIFPSNVIIKSDLKLTLNFFGVNNNETKFSLSINGNLATNKIAETVNGFENINSRIINVNLSNFSEIQSLIESYNYQNSIFYSPFNIPKANYTSNEKLTIGFVDYNFINSSTTSWQDKKFELNNFEYSTETIDHMVSYEKNYGLIIYSQFKIKLTDFDIKGNLDLLSTNFFAKGNVPLKNYFVAGMIIIIFPGIPIVYMVYKRIKKNLE